MDAFTIVLVFGTALALGYFCFEQLKFWAMELNKPLDPPPSEEYTNTGTPLINPVQDQVTLALQGFAEALITVKCNEVVLLQKQVKELDQKLAEADKLVELGNKIVVGWLNVLLPDDADHLEESYRRALDEYICHRNPSWGKYGVDMKPVSEV